METILRRPGHFLRAVLARDYDRLALFHLLQGKSQRLHAVKVDAVAAGKLKAKHVAFSPRSSGRVQRTISGPRTRARKYRKQT